MHDDPNHFGPHFDASLIGANGKLARLHKGKAPPPAEKPPPPVRETARDVVQAAESERQNANQRQGYRRTLFGGEAMPENNNGRKTLLGQ